MTEKVLGILKKRSDFLTLIDQDISRNEQIYEDIEKSLKQVEITCENVRELGEKPEHSALIPLCRNLLYIPGRIIHTGEYLVTTQAHPNSYSILKTLDQTINSLETKIQEQRKLLEKAKVATVQLQERKKILYGEVNDDYLKKLEQMTLHGNEKSDNNESLDSDDDGYDENDEERRLEVASLPKEIYSDKGIALKVGGFYEILEYEES